MCGICFAGSHHLVESEKDVFKELLFHNSSRGTDSTGGFSVHVPSGGVADKQMITWAKSPISPAEFLGTSMMKEIAVPEGDRRVKLLVGHNRLATVGEITKENSHPFLFPNIIGVHNGTVPKDKLKYGAEHGTDSEALIRQIVEVGLKEVVKEHRYGAMALAYYDKKLKTFNIFRNHQRPLHFTAVGGTMYGASEAMMLAWILSRENKPSFVKEIQECKPYHLYTFDMNDSFKTKPEIEDIEPPAEKTYSYGGRGSGSVIPFGRKEYQAPPSITSGTGTGNAGPFDLCVVRVWDTRDGCFKFCYPFFSAMKEGYPPWHKEYDKPARTETDTARDMFLDAPVGPLQVYKQPTELTNAMLENPTKFPGVMVLCPDGRELSLKEFLRWRTRHFASAGSTTSSNDDIATAEDAQYADCRVQKEDDDGEEVELFASHYDTRVFTRGEIEEAMQHGCCNCGDPAGTIEAETSPDGYLKGYLMSVDVGNNFVCEACMNKLATERARGAMQ